MGEFSVQINNFWQQTMTQEITAESAIIKLLISMILGTIIGIERQTRRRSAGMRTFALICMGATAAMLLSIWIPQTYTNFQNGDPGRIAAQILTGIGFLGAGAIIQSRGTVRGLTTAAAIWTSAITGMCVGAGMYWLSIAMTGCTLIVLILFDRLEEKRTLSGEMKSLVITFSSLNVDVESIKQILNKYKLFLIDISVDKDYEQSISKYSFKLHMNTTKSYENLMEELHALGNVKNISMLY